MDIVRQARERFNIVDEFLREQRALGKKDAKFALGDGENNWQWDEADVKSRKKDCRAALTVNITAQHCNQIINNIRMNRPSGSVTPVDGKADVKTAEYLSGMIRTILAASSADDAHDYAAEFSVMSGEGYWQIVTEYESDQSFDKVIKIKPVLDQFHVFIDPFCKELDKSDAKWGFVIEPYHEEAFKDEYGDIEVSDWVEDGVFYKTIDGDKTVIVANYWYCEPTKKTIYQLPDGTITEQLPKGMQAINKRDITENKWKCCELAGCHDKPLHESEWPGKYLPIICVTGKEVTIDGELIRKGLVRDIKDIGRIVNTTYSEMVMSVREQNTTQYMSDLRAIAGFEHIWERAHIDKPVMLPTNDYDPQGNPLSKPQRLEPNQISPALIDLHRISIEEMRAASGQNQANFGIKSDAQSGIGIKRLKEQGEVATFHFPDNLSRALRHEWRILIDLIPKIYDTRRITKILGVDGKETKAIIDVDAQSAHEELDDEALKAIFNPTIGLYDVLIDTGPSFQTQRQEAAAVMTEIAVKDPNFMEFAGDKFFAALDFQGAQEISKRYAKMMPPQLQEQKGKQEIPPEVQQHLQEVDQQMAEMDDMLKHAQEEIGQMNQELQQKELEIQQKDQAIMQEQAKRISSEIQAKQANSLLTITKAEQSMASKMQQPKEMPEGEEPEEEEPDYKDPVLDSILWKLEESADKQLELTEMLAQGQAAMIEALNKPKQSAIKIEKQPDGSYVGVKEEN